MRARSHIISIGSASVRILRVCVCVSVDARLTRLTHTPGHLYAHGRASTHTITVSHCYVWVCVCFSV